jgi:ELWxxDGT repeat protein
MFIGRALRYCCARIRNEHSIVKNRKKESPKLPRVTWLLSILVASLGISQPAAASMIVDANPDGATYPQGFTTVNGVVVYAATDPLHGWELWKTDGTAAGTGIVKEIEPGTSGSFPAALTPAAGLVFFGTSGIFGGYGLWATDGTASGTTMLLSLVGSQLRSITGSPQYAYVVTMANAGAYVLTRSDGTVAGTVQLASFSPPPGATIGSIHDVTPAGTGAFFVADDGVSGSEIWKTDGTPGGTAIALDVMPGPISSSPGNLTLVGGQLFFTATDSAHGFGLWTTDGTQAGTRFLTALQKADSSPLPMSHTGSVNGRFIFSTEDNRVWVSDGTVDGTFVLHAYFPGTSYPPAFSTSGNQGYFVAVVDGSWNQELWKTDGTIQGTGRVMGLSTVTNPAWMRDIDGVTYLGITPPWPLSGEIWRVGSAGLEYLRDVDPGATVSSMVNGAVLNGDIVYAGGDSVHGLEPWKQAIAERNAPAASIDSNTISFGLESMGTTSLASSIVLTNTGPVPINVLGIDLPAGYSLQSACSVVPVGGSCTIAITFTPQSTSNLVTSGTIRTDAGSYTIALSGGGERSLVSHYYESILRREPDSAGKTFWEGEASRVTSIGADVNETWFAMAMSFYFSPEYAAFNRNSTEYLRDMYNTFFNRPADDAGLAYWNGQMTAGMSREAVLTSFMFSPEFNNFTTAIFGASTAAPEANMVMDFYRGLLSRLPDSAGFSYYDGKFRFAQCSFGVGNPNTVVSVAEEMSKAFLSSPEYMARNRSDAQYVADLYNAFMRRGPDVDGYNLYVGQLRDGQLTREALRQIFVSSQEFSGRVAEVKAVGCH